jgi:hypothetical protein
MLLPDIFQETFVQKDNRNEGFILSIGYKKPYQELIIGNGSLKHWMESKFLSTTQASKYSSTLVATTKSAPLENRQSDPNPGEVLNFVVQKQSVFALKFVQMLCIFYIVGFTLGCTPIPQNSVCAPWTGSVDLQKLSKLYKIPQLTISQWERQIRLKSEGSASTPELSRWPQCEYQGEPIQYYSSFSCMNDIFVISRRCNKHKSRPLCGNVCQKLGHAMNVFIAKACSPTYNVDIASRRDRLKKLGELCLTVPSRLKNFEGKCILGVDRDLKSCGFGGNMQSAKAYCKNRKKSFRDCCSTLASSPLMNESIYKGDQNQKHFSDDYSIERALGFQSVNQGKIQPVNSIGVSMTAITVVIVCVCVILIMGVVISYAVRTRRRKKALRKNSKSLKLPRRYDSISAEFPKTTTKYIVKYEYVPNLPDEMELHVGDIIQFYQVSDDRWGDGYNLTSFEEGKACTLYMAPLN